MSKKGNTWQQVLKEEQFSKREKNHEGDH